MRTTTTLAVLGLAGLLSAQVTEFTLYPNGLIYSEAAMGQLHHIVDSLNLRFKVCPADRVYQALPQGLVRLVSMSTGPVKAVAKDMRAGMPLEELKKRHPSVKPAAERRCAFLTYAGEEGMRTTVVPISFSNSMHGFFHMDGDPLSEPGPQQGRWLVDESSYDGKTYLEAVWIVEEPVRTPLPERYGRLVQYVDCMIDTTQQVHPAKASRWHRGEGKTTPSSEELDRMLKRTVTAERPKWDEEATEAERMAAYMDYEAARDRQLDSLARKPGFLAVLELACNETAAVGTGDPFLEELAERNGLHAQALALKRNRRVVGMCSMDSSPRRHALSIATLAAESVQWDIFLRAHLDILNDRFDRVSDGSYAYGARETYVRELEDLELAVPDLLLGSLLHVDNVSTGHYVASANRTGRAITEAKEAEAIAERLLTMIADPDLDLYNRAIAYYAFLNYNGHLKEETAQARNEQALTEAMAGLPKELVGKRR